MIVDEKRKQRKQTIEILSKSPTGIEGLDEITGGGLPTGRPTLIAGNAGCGKTLLAIEFLVQGIMKYDEPGVFVTFEESPEDLMLNVASLGYDLQGFIDKKKLRIDYVKVERSEIEETGEYDLEGLFIRLNYAIDSVGAKRVVLDTIESLFSGFENGAILRAELRRLFQWLKKKGVTAIITGERGEASLTRQGLEEYVSDCVILLDHRIEAQISTRRLRVVKYRGSTHGTNEYPFLIDEDGISVMPVTSLKLDHAVSSKRVSSGILPLDEMLGGGFYEGSNILMTGTAGTGKSNISAHFVNAACEQGNRALYIAFEESPAQIIRNTHSIGLDLQRHVDKGLLKIEATRSSSNGLEMHLAKFYKLIRQFRPSVVVVDPITNLITTGNANEVSAMLGRMMDMFKAENITAIFTSLTDGGTYLEKTEFGVASFVDTWLLLRDYEVNGERNRLIHILKSRGTMHSNQVREFVISDKGIQLVEVYQGPEGILTGTARISAIASDRASDLAGLNETARLQRQLEHNRVSIESQIRSLTDELHMQTSELDSLTDIEKARTDMVLTDKAAATSSRGKATEYHHKSSGLKKQKRPTNARAN
ncbi:MAG: kaiC [Marmoricola sp.]|nr:kaiC [Marmoricola sp.]